MIYFSDVAGKHLLLKNCISFVPIETMDANLLREPDAKKAIIIAEQLRLQDIYVFPINIGVVVRLRRLFRKRGKKGSAS